MNGFAYERALVDVIIEIAEQKGFKAAPLARAAWPEHKDPATKWRKIRNGNPPQELSTRDAYDLAQTLGVSMAALAGIVEGRALANELKQQPNLRKKEKANEQEQPIPTDMAAPARARQPL